MYIKKSFRKNSGRTYLVIAQKYRNPRTGVSTDRTIKSLGYLDELEKEFSDPIAHFTQVARDMTEAENIRKKATLSFSIDEELPKRSYGRKNFGYAAILKIYHSLKLHDFFNNKARSRKFDFNSNSIMLLLVISRILSPGSKRKAFNEKNNYFERFSFTLADIYRALSHFARLKQDTLRHIHEYVRKVYARDTSIIYYDTTNYYFEIDKQDDLRRRGVSKEHRPNPIVQMGLAMDRDGVPVSYGIFPGNLHDSQTFMNVIGEVRRNYETGRIIVVGDMGMITGDNIWYLINGKPDNPLNGYVFSFSVRGGTNDFKEYVLNSDGYKTMDGKIVDDSTNFMIKTRRTPRKIDVTSGNGKTTKKTVHEKQVVFWNRKYADKAKTDRETTLRKAAELIKDPSKYKRATHYGAAKFLHGIDRETGEISPKQIVALDLDAVAEAEKYDGYYAIVTSEFDMSDTDIIKAYRGLWEIEETFRISKGELSTRPIYVSREDHIEAHFLSCFISLVVIRLLQKITGKAFSAERIADCLNRISCSVEQDNIYLFDYRSDVSDSIGDALGINFSRKRLRLGDMKKILGSLKK